MVKRPLGVRRGLKQVRRRKVDKSGGRESELVSSGIKIVSSGIGIEWIDRDGG